MLIDPFDLSQSKLYVSLVGMCAEDARLYRTMATLQALHENTRRALAEWDRRDAR